MTDRTTSGRISDGVGSADPIMSKVYTGVISDLDLDELLVSPSFLIDPFPAYARLRSEDPVHWSEAWGTWVLTRYDDVLAMLRDHHRFSNVGRSAAVELVPEEDRQQLAPLFGN